MERRFTDAEVTEVLSAAAQRQAGGGKEGWTADQVLAMAAELGIDPEHVKPVLGSHGASAVQPSGTTEIVPSGSVSVGAPQNIVLRHRIRKRVPSAAIQDAADDARRMFRRVRRI
jgi:hypothetical protein